MYSNLNYMPDSAVQSHFLIKEKKKVQIFPTLIHSIIYGIIYAHLFIHFTIHLFKTVFKP